MIFNMEKDKIKEVKKLIKCYKALKAMENSYNSLSKKVISFMVRGESINTNKGRVSLAETKYTLIDPITLKDAIEKGTITKENASSWISERYTLTKKGKEALKGNVRALVDITNTSTSERLYVKANDK